MPREAPRKNPQDPELAARRSRGPGGIFWRTFFLIAALITASLLVWYQSVRVLERGPRAQQTGQLIVSVVELTRAALINSDPEKRRDLLIDLKQHEGVRIYSLEPDDQTAPLPDQPLLNGIADYVRRQLGESTRISLERNGQAGLWVSFTIDDDAYWIAFDRGRIDAVQRVQWLGWGGVALLLSLIGAAIISSLISLPLSRLAGASVAIGAGLRPAPLPEDGPREIRRANASFNAMVAELERIEADRALLLAGISHDLRTPLTRLRLEVEINHLDEATRGAMSADIEQMDAIIGQFLDYARPAHAQKAQSEIDLDELARDVAASLPPSADVEISIETSPAQSVRGDQTELRRVILNLVENARRYGRSADESSTRIDITVGGAARPFIEVRDHGPGVPATDLERMKRPFTRLDSARGQANGAGLGLAIVQRIAERHRARFDLSNAPGGGLAARLSFDERAHEERGS